MKRLATILVLTIFSLYTSAQVKQEIYTDLGSSTISSGTFGKLSSITSYKISKYEAGFGIQTTFSGSDQKIISGLFVDVSGDFSIKDFQFTSSIFFKRNPYSSLINETNFGLIASHGRNHLDIQIGYDARIYSMKRSQADLTDLPDPDLRIYELRNFMYKGILWLKTAEHSWNVGGSLTNFDHFLIQQETNPMITALFHYDINTNWRVYSEIWYQGAGMLNLASNYYGFYFRAGFRWQLN